MSDSARRIGISAPGKIVVLGEYAVLEGAPALVAAVDRRATAHFSPLPGLGNSKFSQSLTIQTHPLGEELVCIRDARGLFQPAQDVPPALTLIQAILAAYQQRQKAQLPAGEIVLDSRAFFHNGVKLGLGSSAAVAVSFSALLAKLTGNQELSNPHALFQFVHPVHRAFQQGRGSGVDVAASCFGGFLRFEGPRASPPPVDPACDAQALARELEGRSFEDAQPRFTQVRVHPMAPPKNLRFEVVFVGKSAKTPHFLARFESFKAENPRQFWQLLEELATVSHAGVEMFSLGETTAFLALVHRFHAALGRLGDCLGEDVVTQEHVRIAAGVARWHAAYKSCGAGGGDVGLALMAKWWTRWFVRRGIQRAGGILVQSSLGALGVADAP